MIRRELMIINKLGLHARAASKLVGCASAFGSEIWLRRGDREVNGKSIMGVLTLAASRGSVLEVCTRGPDESAAMDALALLVENRFGEDE